MYVIYRSSSEAASFHLNTTFHTPENFMKFLLLTGSHFMTLTYFTALTYALSYSPAGASP